MLCVFLKFKQFHHIQLLTSERNFGWKNPSIECFLLHRPLWSSTIIKLSPSDVLRNISENIRTMESTPLVLLTSLPTFPESHVTNLAGRQAHRVTSSKFPSLYEGHCPLRVCWTAHLPFQPPTDWECEACKVDTSHLEGLTSLLKGKLSENGKEKWI